MRLLRKTEEKIEVRYTFQRESEEQFGILISFDNGFYELRVGKGKVTDALRAYNRLNNARITINGNPINYNDFERDYGSKIARIVEEKCTVKT